MMEVKMFLVGSYSRLGSVPQCNAQLGHPVQRRFVGMDPQPGFSTSSVGAHFSGRVQERIWNAMIARDARGAATLLC